MSNVKVPEKFKGFFDGMENVKDSNKGSWYTPGTYWVAIEKADLDTDRKGRRFWRVIGTVIRTVHAEEDAERGNSHGPGTDVVDMSMESNELYMRGAIRFVAALSGVSFDSVSPEDAFEVFLQPEVTRGVVMEVKGRPYVSKANKPGTGVDYIRVVPFKEVKETFTEKGIDPDDFFPKGHLETMIEIEQEEEEDQ